MNSDLRLVMYGVMSYSHFCEANSAVHTTSDEKMSHSPDLACWRWMNCVRCASAEAGNSRSLTVTPFFWALNALIHACVTPVVSLPEQYVTLPLALFIEFGSMTFAPFVWSWPPDELELELEPPPPLSPPQAATTKAHTDTATAATTPK